MKPYFLLNYSTTTIQSFKSVNNLALDATFGLPVVNKMDNGIADLKMRLMLSLEFYDAIQIILIRFIKLKFSIKRKIPPFIFKKYIKVKEIREEILETAEHDRTQVP